MGRVLEDGIEVIRLPGNDRGIGQQFVRQANKVRLGGTIKGKLRQVVLLVQMLEEAVELPRQHRALSGLNARLRQDIVSWWYSPLRGRFLLISLCGLIRPGHRGGRFC